MSGGGTSKVAATHGEGPDVDALERLVREAYEEGVEDGIGWHAYPESGPKPEWIDSVARVETLKALAAIKQGERP